jgi:hypothetical protein
MASHLPDDFINLRTEGYLLIKDMVQRLWLKINTDAIIHQLLTIRYRFDSKGKKCLQTKEQMKKDGIKSPDDADALMMACTQIKNINKALGIQTRNRTRHPSTYKEQDLFSIGGVR